MGGGLLHRAGTSVRVGRWFCHGKTSINTPIQYSHTHTYAAVKTRGEKNVSYYYYYYYYYYQYLYLYIYICIHVYMIIIFSDESIRVVEPIQKINK